jgi:hypothetical protein
MKYKKELVRRPKMQKKYVVELTSEERKQLLDNLNTHSEGSFYEAFEPAEARRLAEKLEIHYTPKYGSWLNMAEIEIGVLSRQCLSQYIESKEQMIFEVGAW